MATTTGGSAHRRRWRHAKVRAQSWRAARRATAASSTTRWKRFASMAPIAPIRTRAVLSGDAAELCGHRADTRVPVCDGQSSTGSRRLSARPVRRRQLWRNENRTYQAFVNAAAPVGGGRASLCVRRLFAQGNHCVRILSSARPTPRIRRSGSFPTATCRCCLATPSTIPPHSASRARSSTDWNYDLSANVGENYLDLSASNTVNPSLGDASPTEHYIGRTTFNQRIGELNVSRYFDQAGPLQSPQSRASARRCAATTSRSSSGSLGSYQVGPLAISGKAVGSSGRPGIAPADEIDLSRTNVGRLCRCGVRHHRSRCCSRRALRYEHYSDFGDNLSGKFAARYKLNDHVRASRLIQSRLPRAVARRSSAIV